MRVKPINLIYLYLIIKKIKLLLRPSIFTLTFHENYRRYHRQVKNGSCVYAETVPFAPYPMPSKLGILQSLEH
jgi:hypothetical protein